MVRTSKLFIINMLTLISASLFGSVESAAAAGRLVVEVDPRIELLAAVQAVSGYNDRLGLLTQLECSYKTALYEHFTPFADHQAVAMFDRMSAQSFSFDAPVWMVLHLSPPPELLPQAEFDAEILARAGGEEVLNRFLVLLRRFAVDTKFTEFFKAHREDYEKMVAVARDTIGTADYVAMLEDYYGISQYGYHIVLAPIFHAGGFGPRVRMPDGRFDIYNVLGPQTVVADIPVFADANNFRHIAMHEFSHSFVNPLTERFDSLVTDLDTLFVPVRETMEGMRYGIWETCVNEHIVRAVTTRMTYGVRGEEAGQKQEKSERDRGFVYIGALTETLVDYESHRGRYPMFADFYPTLLSALDQFRRIDVVKTFGLDQFRGTINGVTQNVRSIAIIMPTAERDTTALRRIREYATKVQKMLYKDNELIDDTVALSRDLSEYAVVVYGTMEGNLWLAHYADRFPFTISADAIHADSVYTGADLRFISAWPHPENPARGILIYTAAQAAQIAGINSVFHGPTDFVVARDTEVLRASSYSKTDNGWSLPSR